MPPKIKPLPDLTQTSQAVKLLSEKNKKTSTVEFTRLAGAALAGVLSELARKYEGRILVVTPEPEEAEDLASDLGLYEMSSLVFPAWDILPGETEHPDMDLAKERVGALRSLYQGSREIIITSSTALLQPVLPAEVLQTGQLAVRAGLEISPVALSARLVDAGFEVVDEVEYPGQFARRGGILDVYPFFSGRPVRIEYFGDEIDTLRYFDACTQRSEAPHEGEIIIIDINKDSFHQAYSRKDKVRLFSYLPPKSLLVLVYPQRIEYTANLYHSGFDRHSPLFSFERAVENIGKQNIIIVPELAGEEISPEYGEVVGAVEPESLDFNCVTLERFSGGMEVAFSELENLVEQGNKVFVYCNNAAERTRLEELLFERGGGLAAKLELRIGELSNGFHARSEKFIITSDQEILGRVQIRRKTKKRIVGAPIASFSELRPGDYVVHLSHGIAIYEGLETLDNNETQADYLRLRFADQARIYVPLSHVDLVQRFIGGKDGKPTLSKLGSASWQNKKKAAAQAARDIAADLLRLQAARNALPGTAFADDGALQNEFEAAFAYAETPDQLSAISDIKIDQQKTAPMDRLLCGDVGFGKTEVAMRAAFKVVEAGKQVAVLVPTTILAEQHHRTFSERMADYPVTVACLSRFRTPEESKTILDRLETGGIDIIIGTHRVLSQDVKFRDLGLVVIDEEQRFGVEQKEKLKQMRVSVDILSMSATPIPRTLNMALLGLRDISNLATPPTERQSIKTEVVRYNEELIRRAVLRELSRGGQVFFLHNRVHNIHRVARELGELIPEARFGVAHGQMPEQQLFRVMNNFIEKKLDVLVCTTIIESGVDIPSVNTLFVNNADHFGLSALHQLRGRVGRYRHKAYAYFLIPPKRPVTPIAQKRLRALEEYSELGAGFRLAMRDLEIRGAGNILGAEQSGHIHLIGFELYCRLLEKSVAELKGLDVDEHEPVELDLGTMAYIPTEYIASDAQRIDFYRRLSSAYDDESLENLAAYLRDRYGTPPEMVLSLMQDQKLRQMAQLAGINYIGRIDTALVIGFAKNKGGPGLRKLRLLRRKVTALEKARWRVSVSSKETFIDAAYKIIRKLQLSDGEIGELDRQEKEQTKVELKGKPVLKSAAGNDVRYQQMSSSYSGVYAQRLKARMNAEDEEKPEEKKDSGAAIIALIADERLGTIGVVVNENEFDLRRFGTVTLICGRQRFFMRYTGASHNNDKRVTLNLRASTPDEVIQVTEANLKCGGGRIISGLAED